MAQTESTEKTKLTGKHADVRDNLWVFPCDNCGASVYAMYEGHDEEGRDHFTVLGRLNGEGHICPKGTGDKDNPSWVCTKPKRASPFEATLLIGALNLK